MSIIFYFKVDPSETDDIKRESLYIQIDNSDNINEITSQIKYIVAYDRVRKIITNNINLKAARYFHL